MSENVDDIPFQQFNQYLNCCYHTKQAYEQLKSIRKCISTNSDINQGVIKIMNINFHNTLMKYTWSILNLNPHQFTPLIKKILLESIWIFINICSTTQVNTQLVMEAGIVNLINKLFMHQNDYVIMEMVFELIGNITGESNINYKLYFLKNIQMYNFINNHMLNYWQSPKFPEIVTWVLSNCFILSSHEFSNLEKQPIIVDSYLNLFAKMLQLPKLTNHQVYTNIYLALINFTNESSKWVLQIYNLIKQLYHQETIQNKIYLMRLIGNMIANTQIGVFHALNHPYFLNDILYILKGNLTVEIRRQAAWILSNIFAGTRQQIDYCLNNNPTLFNDLFQIISFNHQTKTVNQLFWIFSNLINSSSNITFTALFQANFVPFFCQRFQQFEKNADQQIIMVFIQGIFKFTSKVQKSPNFSLNAQQKNYIAGALFILQQRMDYYNFTEQKRYQFEKKLEILKKVYLKNEDIEADLLYKLSQLNIDM